LEFVKKVNNYGADLTIANNYKDDFKEAKNIYLNDEFKKVNNLLAEEKFNEAELLLKELKKN
jgi:hypothetical protein